MLQTKSKKIILLAIIILAVFATTYFVLSAISIGPGLPEPEGMVYWYVPDYLKDNKLDPSPYFPAISEYSDSMNYTSKTIMTVWYFDDPDDLQRGEEELCRYLKEHGDVFSDTVDITEEGQEYDNKTDMDLTSLNVTRYESEETSGYFQLIIQPFGDGLDHYFIIYYGTKGKTLTEGNGIKKTVAKQYQRNYKGGDIRGLNDCITQTSAFNVSDSTTSGKLYENIAVLSQYGLENCTNPESPIYDPSVVNAYGKVPLIHNASQLNGFADKLRIIRENSWNEIDFYPNGSIVRYGSGTSRGYFWIELYDKGNEKYSENDTRKIYEIVEKYSIKNGVENIPVVFTLTNETEIIGFMEFPIYWYDVDNNSGEEIENLNDIENSSLPEENNKQTPSHGVLISIILVVSACVAIRKQ
ncbi:MAG: hypothetical protein RBT65_00075 [Methanolobus sp.]|nr:hypothetical protein [Methanolobus sp.]